MTTTTTQAEQNIEARERADRAQRIAAEQTRLDRERTAEERAASNTRVREAQDRREADIRERLTPVATFAYNGYRMHVLLGDGSAARVNMATHACSVIARFLSNAFFDAVGRYRTTAEQPPVVDWPSHLLALGEINPSVVIAEKIENETPSA
jgi:hypothetical protein